MSADAIVNRRLKLVDDTVDAYTRRLEGVANRLQLKMTKMIASGNMGDPLVDAALARAQIERLLVESGYYEVGESLLNEGYQQVLKDSYDIYRENLKGLQFSDLDASRLNAIKNMDFATFNSMGADTVDTLQRIYLDLNFGASSMDSAIEQMRQALGDDMKRYASTFVRTSVHSFERVASSEIALQGGLELFKYVGPYDSITREFCKDHLGKVRTWEEWTKISNEGQPGPITVYGGGYNCRHELVPVLERE